MKFLLSILFFYPFFVSVNPIYEETLENARYCREDGSFINTLWSKENCNNGDTAHGTAYDFALRRVTDTIYEGAKALHFEIREDQPPVGSIQRIRSEITIIKGDVDPRFTTEMWYSYAIYFPAGGTESDVSHETITQWYQNGGDDCTVKVRSGKAYLEMIHPTTSSLNRYDLFGAANAAPATSTGTVVSSFTTIPRDTWHVFVFHYIHSEGADGLLEIWRDGTKIQTINGRNMYTSILPKWKMGIYKSDYTSNPGLSTSPRRILFFDNIRLGDKNSKYADMVTTPPVGNIAPVAAAGSDQTITLPTSSVSLSGTASTDSDGTIITYAWSKISGVGGTITSASSATTTVTGLTTGTYVFRLTVTDNNGATDIDDVTIIVLPTPNVAPVAAAGSDQSITLPTSSVSLNGSGSTDSDGTITTYAWIKISGTGGTISTPASATTTVTGLIAGTYTFRLTVTDNSGASATDLVSVIVNPSIPPPNTPPTANAGANQTITLPTSTTTLTGSGNDPDGSVVDFAWVKISGPIGGTLLSPNSAITTVTGLQEGIYTFQFTVTDNGGSTGTNIMQVTVNKAPVAATPQVIRTKKPYSVSNERNGVPY